MAVYRITRFTTVNMETKAFAVEQKRIMPENHIRASNPIITSRTRNRSAMYSGVASAFAWAVHRFGPWYGFPGAVGGGGAGAAGAGCCWPPRPLPRRPRRRSSAASCASAAAIRAGCFPRSSSASVRSFPAGVRHFTEYAACFRRSSSISDSSPPRTPGNA